MSQTGARGLQRKVKGRQLKTSHQPQTQQQACYKTGHQLEQNNHPYKILPTPKQITNTHYKLQNYLKKQSPGSQDHS
jgi:hypothetical protein